MGKVQLNQCSYRVLGINYLSILKWKGLCLKASLYCSVKSNNFHMPGRIPSAKPPEIRVQPEFCDGAPFSLGFKRNRTTSSSTI